MRALPTSVPLIIAALKQTQDVDVAAMKPLTDEFNVALHIAAVALRKIAPVAGEVDENTKQMVSETLHVRETDAIQGIDD
jgi:hypothetical protein